MKHLITLGLLICCLFCYKYSQAQDVKIKTKGGKTKVKEVHASNSTDNINIPSTHMSAINNAYNLTNTSWKTYIGDPINDTIVIHYAIDSSSVRSKSTGEIMVTGIYKVMKDTLSFNDLSGAHACPSNMIAKYKLILNGDTMQLDLIEDECEGRGDALKDTIWQRVKESQAKE